MHACLNPLPFTWVVLCAYVLFIFPKIGPFMEQSPLKAINSIMAPFWLSRGLKKDTSRSTWKLLAKSPALFRASLQNCPKPLTFVPCTREWIIPTTPLYPLLVDTHLVRGLKVTVTAASPACFVPMKKLSHPRQVTRIRIPNLWVETLRCVPFLFQVHAHNEDEGVGWSRFDGLACQFCAYFLFFCGDVCFPNDGPSPVLYLPKAKVHPLVW